MRNHKKVSFDDDRLSAGEAQFRAQMIAWGPILFQVARILLKSRIFEEIRESKNGLTEEEIVKICEKEYNLYAIRVLLECALVSEIVFLENERYKIAKTGWFLLNDESIRANIDFNHFINYRGMFDLEESFKKSSPEGLKTLGNWPTIYEGLSQLSDEEKKSWFGFDHFYSDASFSRAIEIINKNSLKTLWDVGGNTGKFALEFVQFKHDVKVTILDLEGQLSMMRENIKKTPEAARINSFAIDWLSEEGTQNLKNLSSPDAVWMSQFLDCFSFGQAVNILTKISKNVSHDTRIYIMETLFDRQKYSSAAFCIAMTSPYFTAMANGNSKMFSTRELTEIIHQGNLKIEEIFDGIGFGHSIFCCRKV